MIKTFVFCLLISVALAKILPSKLEKNNLERHEVVVSERHLKCRDTDGTGRHLECKELTSEDAANLRKRRQEDRHGGLGGLFGGLFGGGGHNNYNNRPYNGGFQGGHNGGFQGGHNGGHGGHGNGHGHGHGGHGNGHGHGGHGHHQGHFRRSTGDQEEATLNTLGARTPLELPPPFPHGMMRRNTSPFGDTISTKNVPNVDNVDTRPKRHVMPGHHDPHNMAPNHHPGPSQHMGHHSPHHFSHGGNHGRGHFRRSINQLGESEIRTPRQQMVPPGYGYGTYGLIDPADGGFGYPGFVGNPMVGMGGVAIL